MVKAAEPIILRWVRATTADNFSVEKLKELRIPLPPLPEQQRIAAILDQADEHRRLRYRSIAAVESLRGAFFDEMFARQFGEDGPLISEVCDSIANWKPEHDAGTASFLYLDLGSIDQQAKRLCLPEPILRREAPSRARQLVRKGDVLVSTVRPYLNGVAVVPEVPEDATASTGFTVLRPRIDETTTSFLFSVVRSKKFINEMVRLSTGASYPAVSDKIVKNFRLPQSTRKERGELDAKMTICDEQIRSNEASLLRAEELFRSLQHRAFRGEL
jgi:restriction endonuclease S subunit